MASRRSETGGLACKAFDKAHMTAYGHLFNNEAQALRRLTVVDVPRVVKLSSVLRLKAEGIGWIVMEYDFRNRPLPVDWDAFAVAASLACLFVYVLNEGFYVSMLSAGWWRVRFWESGARTLPPHLACWSQK